MAEITPSERGRRGYSLFLKRIADLVQGDIAKAMNTSDTRVSELKTKQMEQCIELLAHCGLKVVPSEYACMTRAAHEFLTASHRQIVQVAPQLLWGENE